MPGDTTRVILSTCPCCGRKISLKLGKPVNRTLRDFDEEYAGFTPAARALLQRKEINWDLLLGHSVSGDRKNPSGSAVATGSNGSDFTSRRHKK